MAWGAAGPPGHDVALEGLQQGRRAALTFSMKLTKGGGMQSEGQAGAAQPHGPHGVCQKTRAS